MTEQNPKAQPRLAMDPPATRVTLLDTALIDTAIQASRESPRRRMILPFHKSNSDNLHRMLNALQPGSYIQPHRHLDPPKAESVLVLKGSIQFVVFDDTGHVTQQVQLAASSDTIGVDVEPGVFHTFFAVEKDTVLFEIKPGPYEKTSDKDFAPWAPPEGSDEADSYLQQLVHAH